LAGEPEVRQKPDVWKRVVIIGGAILGGLAGWRYADTFGPVFDIVMGVVVGTMLARMVWDVSNEEPSDREPGDRESCDGMSGRGGF
jgi:hypothetical protein